MSKAKDLVLAALGCTDDHADKIIDCANADRLAAIERAEGRPTLIEYLCKLCLDEAPQAATPEPASEPAAPPDPEPPKKATPAAADKAKKKGPRRNRKDD